MISENCYNFIVLKYKELQTIIAMITKDKVIEIFCMADDFYKFFDAMMEKYTLKTFKQRDWKGLPAHASFVSIACLLQLFCGVPKPSVCSSCPVHQESIFGEVTIYVSSG